MDIGTPESTKQETPKESTGGFFQNLFASLFSSHNPEADKKRRLKSIAKDLSKTKYHSFYKASSGEMLPPFAKLFYDIYKIIYPAQNYIRSTSNPASFKTQVINYCLSDNQVNLLSQLSEENILDKSKTVPLKDLKVQVNSSLEKFMSEFDGDHAFRTDSIYRAYLSFIDFCSFDYFFMIKKFTRGLKEGDFSSAPTFEKISAEYLLEDLQDFITILYSIPEDISWEPFFAMLKSVRGELVSVGVWKKMISRLKAIQTSHAFEMLVKLITKNPVFEPKLTVHNETIVDTYLEKIRNDTHELMTQIESRQKTSKENGLCMQVFGTTAIDLLKNYSKTNSVMLQKKDLNYYVYSNALNYLKEFLIETVKTDLRTYSDLVLIRGQWDASISAPFSNAYQELLQTSDKITTFDNSLAEDEGPGLKIKTLLPKIAHDPGAENIINRIVSDANETAKEYIAVSSQNLIVIGRMIKQLIEDEKQEKPVLVANWSELERYSERPMIEFGVDLYKKIYLFVQLMQSCISDQASE